MDYQDIVNQDTTSISEPCEDVDFLLVDLVDALEEIEKSQPIAKLNEISIIDLKGGRIYF